MTLTDEERLLDDLDRDDRRRSAPALEAPLSREQIAELRAALTMGDMYAVQRDVPAAKDDPELMMRLVMQRRAERLGMIGAGSSLEAFLDRLRVEDVSWAFSDEVRNPTLGALASAPGSIATGASGPSTSTPSETAG